ncbi:hypothetical protein EON67_00775 [archaeon]|nr:MAG: hypothetical protein EON67_00775 [archaeon]
MPCNGQSLSVSLASNNSVAYFNERGMDCAYPSGISNPANCVHKIVRPHTVAAAQWFFGCPTLNGAELENQLDACQLQGSHWEQRIFNQEFMTSYVQHVSIITPLTLALFEDSGWYQANYTGLGSVGWMRPNADWGFKQGCDFALQKCVTPAAGTSTTPTFGNPATVLGTPAHFLSYQPTVQNGDAVCTTDLRALATTNVVQYNDALPTQFQYFTDGGIGNAVAEFDYCPAVTAYTSKTCWVSSNAGVNAFYFGETYGASSACLLSTLRITGVTYVLYTAARVHVTHVLLRECYRTFGARDACARVRVLPFACRPDAGQGAGCYEVTCTNATVAIISVGAPQVGGVRPNVTCTDADAGVSKTVAGFNGVLTCPSMTAVCGPVTRYAGYVACALHYVGGSAVACGVHVCCRQACVHACVRVCVRSHVCDAETARSRRKLCRGRSPCPSSCPLPRPLPCPPAHHPPTCPHPALQMRQPPRPRRRCLPLPSFSLPRSRWRLPPCKTL